MSQHPAPGVPQPNQSALPEGHPLRTLGTQLGVVTEVGGPQAAPQAGVLPQGGPPAASMPQMHSQLISQAPVDPLSRPYTLPSGGLLYGDHPGTVLISPMRGEQEEIIAGAGSGLSATPALRHVVEQCVNCQGIPYEELELADWSAALLHLLAMSMGSDRIPLYPTCPSCNQQFDGSRVLGKVPCRVLRRAKQGEVTNWPPESTLDEAEELKILREMGLGDDDPEQSAEQVFVAGTVEEPIEVTLSTGQMIGWRYLRLKDLIQAEEFAERAMSTQATSTGSKLHSFINARYIATINGRRVGVIEAMKWTRQAPMPLLVEFRSHIERRSFGYELSPTFRCPNGHSFRQPLPLDGAMFRRRAGASFG